jgi:hypothetical protein
MTKSKSYGLRRGRYRINQDQDNQSRKSLSLLEWIKEHLKTTGDLRDGLLISASILYVVGYLVWSSNAWQNQLGLLPALDPQYFVAGLVPVVIMLAAFIGGTYFKRFLVDRWPVLVGTDAKGIWKVIRVTLLFMFWPALALVAFGPFLGALLLLFYLGYKLLRRFAPGIWLRLADKEVKGWKLLVRLAVSLLAFAAFLVLLFKRDYFSRAILSGRARSVDSVLMIGFVIAVTLLPPMAGDLFSWLSRFYRWLWVYFGVLMFVLLGLTFYIERVYPNFPQEFGGVRPRCAYLDLVKSQVSDETLQGIVPSDAIKSGQPVVRSLKVDVLYAGSSVILVRSNEKVYEIAKSVIPAINGCGETKAQRAAEWNSR